MTRDRVMTALRDALPGLRRDFGVETLELFGSVARGDDRPGSDVDVLVRFTAGARVTLMTLAKLAVHLEDAVGRPVDVVEDHDALRPAFRSAARSDALRVA